MNKYTFVERIKTKCADSIPQEMIEFLLNPPGRNPEKNLIEMSFWLRQLEEQDIMFLKRILHQAVCQSVFSFLCVLDGVSFIEGYGDKGTFELFYCKNGVKELLNDNVESDLHDIFSGFE